MSVARNIRIDAFNAAIKIFAENGDFVSSQSVDKCSRYIDALNTMIPILMQRSQIGGAAGEMTQWSIKDLIDQRDYASRWLSAKRQINSRRNSRVGFRCYRK